MWIDSCFWQSPFDPVLGCFKTPRVGANYGAPNERGYMKLTLRTKEGNWQTVRVNRAIWMAANRQRIPEGRCVMHMNDVRSDNRICNLRLGTNSENTLMSIPNRTTRKKPTSYRYKCVSIDSKGNRRSFASIAECARFHKVSASTVNKVFHEKRYYKHAIDAEGNKFRIIKNDAKLVVELVAPKCNHTMDTSTEAITKPQRDQNSEKGGSVCSPQKIL